MPCWITDCTTAPQVQWRRRLPDSEDVTPVFACGTHAISLDSAAQVHLATCEPDPGRLPACGCTPEPLPVEANLPDPTALPTGWILHPSPPTASDTPGGI